ncbi:hypothetical protein [Nonomuraea sp. NPDC048916]|uniref:hypothetical protein n=1 Tax=Nonomuraea sp. NPDC048916 TaxID=3154232 RepID=UPI0033F3F1AC
MTAENVNILSLEHLDLETGTVCCPALKMPMVFIGEVSSGVGKVLVNRYACPRRR